MKRILQQVLLIGTVVLSLSIVVSSCHSGGKKDDKRTCYFGIVATPKDASIRIDGKKRDTIIVKPGTVVNWKVSKKGYVTESGTDTVRNEIFKSVHRVSLQKAPESTAKQSGKKRPFLKYVVALIVLLLGGSFVFYWRKRRINNKSMDSNNPASNQENGILVAEPAKDDLGTVQNVEADKEASTQITTSLSVGTKRKGQDKFAILANDWEVVGASVQGNGHKSSNMPCQDSCAYEYLKDGWGIAITSDGAGSAEHSDVGSKITIARAMIYFKQLIEDERWIEKKELPTDNSWTRLAVAEIRKVRDDIYGFSDKNKIEFKSLSATIIVVVHSPQGVLVAHVGDGRAGVRDMDGVWHPIITPHKGEEANQTIFLTSGFWNIPSFEMSGVMVPETRVIRQPVSAFTLMSDGCENTSWLCNQKDEQTGHYYDPNKPFNKFFDPLIASLGKESLDGVTEDEIEANWQSFITDGTRGFVSESDDKTMILGFLRG